MTFVSAISIKMYFMTMNRRGQWLYLRNTSHIIR